MNSPKNGVHYKSDNTHGVEQNISNISSRHHLYSQQRTSYQNSYLIVEGVRT